MIALLIAAILSFTTINSPNITHDAAAAVGIAGGVSLAIVVIFGIFLGLSIWFLKVINQYRSFLTVRSLRFEKTAMFSCTLIGTRTCAWPTLG